MISYEYIDLKDVLQKIVQQAKKDVDFCKKSIPNFVQTPEQLFYFLQPLISYQDDPKGMELLQSPKSLFQKNYYGIPGRGDCDCFSILSIACFLGMGFNPQDIKIILAGKNNKDAIHIYTEVFYKNQWHIFDLTESFFGIKRNYEYLQRISLSKF